ncbi:MAG TPA: condensation domain-containing protein, partial [Chthoniobacteraceae bacterium]|nr:condensation domain-containing protein [Chthoniobacteraceae bacterium]
MLYPLSPLQHGMLSHALRSPRDGINIEQTTVHVCEELDVPAFEEAWRRVIARHDVLRTAFCWKDQPEPMQRVHASVEVALHFEDWRALGDDARPQKYEAFLESDRARGFDLAVAPLMRTALLRFGEREYQFVWTFHHAVLDGRAFVMVMREFWAIYDAILRGGDPALPPAPQYRDFIEWLGKRDHSVSEKFWREALKGFPAANVIDLPRRAAEHPAHHEHARSLSREATAALATAASAHGVSVNTLVQAAWALLLSRYSREEDVVFGSVRACRHFGIRDAKKMAGLFINTLPMRAVITPDLPLGDLLKGLRSLQRAQRDHEQTPQFEIQRWSGVAPLFRSVVIF